MSRFRNARSILSVLFFLFASVLLVSCNTGTTVVVADPQQQAEHEAKQKAAGGEFYTPTSDIERRNINWRLETSDDPNTILWCTVFPYSAEPITVAVQGKLTSGGKRLRPSQQQFSQTGGEYRNEIMYHPELPDENGTYGSSGDYRFGFGPAGKSDYIDLYGMATMCRTEPTSFQVNNTQLVIAIDENARDLTNQAEEALRNGDAARAQELLSSITNQRTADAEVEARPAAEVPDAPAAPSASEEAAPEASPAP